MIKIQASKFESSTKCASAFTRFSITKLVFSMMLMLLLSSCKTPVILDPQGSIAASELNIIYVAIFLMLIVVIPVFIMTFLFAYKYRATNKNAKYTPNWAHSNFVELVCWGVPLIIIFILGTITWESSHRLDPYKPLESNVKPITIQVVALNWKWLFIYPEQNIATVNYLQFPEHTPINFKITADAPMNSFQIPALGGQIYAMTGMQTKLHLIADKKGDYNGSSVSFSGEGFSDMKFIAHVGSQEEFDQWVKSVKFSNVSNGILNTNTYNELVKPSINHKPEFYSFVEDNLYSNIIMKYMMPM